MRLVSTMIVATCACAVGSLFACASNAKRAAACERALDSADKRMDTTTHFPSQVRLDSTVKAGEIEGVVVSALTDESLYGTALYLHGADTSRHDAQLADRDGRFRIVSRAPGRLVIVARLIGYKPDSVAIDSDAGSSVKIALRVNPLRFSSACCFPPPGSICL
jgi:hypothetical protein